MDAVSLEHRPVRCDTFHQEGHEPGVFVFGDRRKQLGEALRVVATIIGRNLPAHDQRLGIRFARCLGHGAQVLFGHGQRQAAQRVVRPQFQHHHRWRVLAQQRRQARHAAAGRVAADAGIDHLPVPRFRPYSADRLSPTTNTVREAEPWAAAAV
ncbi:hypothetical protein G6F68_018095 [Rhizopus microsporus]|nr:hypothetical protein G6F68_018095 [Rhizopus microsporus]